LKKYLNQQSMIHCGKKMTVNYRFEHKTAPSADTLRTAIGATNL